MRFFSKYFHCSFRLFIHNKVKPVLSIAIIVFLIYWLYFLINLNNTTDLDIIIEPSEATRKSNDFVTLRVNLGLYVIMNLKPSKSNIPFVGKPFFTILVASDVRNDELRSAHRRAMPKEVLDSMNVIRIFLLAKIPLHEE